MSTVHSSVKPSLESESDEYPPRRVAVWRHTWLPSCETFVRNHVDSIQQWEAVTVGAGKEASVLSAPTDNILFSERERIRRRSFEILRMSGRVERFLRNGRFDLVHAHFGNDAILIAPICRRLGLPLIVTVHGEDVTALAQRPGPAGTIYRYRLRRTLHQAAGVLAVSDYIANCARRFVADPVTVHTLGVPVPPLTETKEPIWDVLYTGRLVEKKGVADLLHALNVLKDKGIGVRTAVAGTGPLEGELRSIALEHDLDVTFLGLQPPQEIRHLMSSSRMVAVPSKQAENGDCEGLPTVVMEAAAAARPVVGYRHSGIEEAVISGVTGLLAREGDYEGLAHDIGLLIREPQTSQRMGEAARSQAERHFDIRKQTQALEALYDEAAARPLERRQR